MQKRMPSAEVVARAQSMGAAGEKWLEELGSMIAALESEWNLRVGEAINGGTHAFVAPADGHDGAAYILKIDVPDLSEGEYMNEIRTLQIAGGEGFVRLFRVDSARRAALLERLGPRLKDKGYPVDKQIGILCDALVRTWRMPVDNPALPDGADCIAWFRSFIAQSWEELGRPCSEAVIARAMEYLADREANLNPAQYVLIHGDVHNNNALESLSEPGAFKLIDPDGIFYEPGYDLGVLMREWPGEYAENPLENGLRRCALLSRLTGADEDSIWQWGFLQTVSTSFVLMQIGQKALAEKMLAVAEAWTVR